MWLLENLKLPMWLAYMFLLNSAALTDTLSDVALDKKQSQA